MNENLGTNNSEIISECELLRAVNNAMAKNGFLPTVSDKYVRDLINLADNNDVLREKKIVLVDNMPMMIEAFIPVLTVVTNDNADFILHKDETLYALTKKVISKKPDVVLVDYNLAGRVRGDELTWLLRDTDPDIQCIGFSTENHALAFRAAGALGSVEKLPYQNEIVIPAIAQLLA